MGQSKEETPEIYPLRITESALRDLDNISGYIAFVKHQPLNAARVGDKFFEVFDRIALNPRAFRECEELPTKSKKYRKAVCMSWNVVFKINALEVIVLGIIHGSRSPSKTRRLRRVK